MLIPKFPEKHSIGATFFGYLSSDTEFIRKRKNVCVVIKINTQAKFVIF